MNTQRFRLSLMVAGILCNIHYKIVPQDNYNQIGNIVTFSECRPLHSYNLYLLKLESELLTPLDRV